MAFVDFKFRLWSSKFSVLLVFVIVPCDVFGEIHLRHVMCYSLVQFLFFLFFPTNPPVLNETNETMFLALTQQKISGTKITPKFCQIDFLNFASYIQYSRFNFYINLIRVFGIAAYLIWPSSLRQIDDNKNVSFEFLNRNVDVFQYHNLTLPITTRFSISLS